MAYRTRCRREGFAYALWSLELLAAQGGAAHRFATAGRVCSSPGRLRVRLARRQTTARRPRQRQACGVARPRITYWRTPGDHRGRLAVADWQMMMNMTTKIEFPAD